MNILRIKAKYVPEGKHFYFAGDIYKVIDAEKAEDDNTDRMTLLDYANNEIKSCGKELTVTVKTNAKDLAEYLIKSHKEEISELD